ncbi:MAG: PilW family protein [Gammaproteobacteria bacterium]|nr:PilW family protein [Gammaproteobacteria bacterium]
MKTARRQTGLSLIEMMVASAVAMILLMGIAQMLTATQQFNRANSEQSDLQTAARYVFHILSEEVRQAGMFGCSKLTEDNYTSSISPFDSYAHAFNIGIQGYSKSAGAALPDELGNLTITGSDILIVRRAYELGFRLIQESNDTTLFNELVSGPENNACNSNTTDRINEICAGDVLIAVDCSKGRSFVASSVDTANNADGDQMALIEHIGINNVPGNWGGPSSDNPMDKFSLQDTLVNKAATTAYFIRTNSKGDEYIFSKRVNGNIDRNNTEELVRGVEELRILYGLDSDNDGSVDRYLASTAAELAQAETYNQVVSLKIAILVSSLNKVLLAHEIPTPAPTINYQLLDQNISRTMDGKIRRVFTKTINLRNGGMS